MRTGIAVWNFAGERLDAKLRLFAEMGYTAASVNNRLLDSFSDRDEAEANKVLEEFDLLLTVHGGLIKDNPQQDKLTALARAERLVQWQRNTGRILYSSYDVPWIVVEPGVRRKNTAAAADFLESLLPVFEGAGIRVLLEDCPMNPEATDDLRNVKEKHPSLGVLLDLGHMNIRLREPSHNPEPLEPSAIENYIKQIPWEIAELHVHSNNGARDQHAPPYAPNADLVTAARTLGEIGFQGVSTIELVPAWCALPDDEILPACRKSRDYWEGLMEAAI